MNTMKVISYETKEFERSAFRRAEELGLEIRHVTETLTAENVGLAAGCKGVTTLGFSDLRAAMLEQLAEQGIRYLATRTVGYNHIDLEAAVRLGIRVSNASYDPYNVADFTVMIILMLLRKAKVSVCRALVNDFSLDGMLGREMRNLTIGVIGAGKIGRAVIRNLSGFGCRILAYDPYVKPEQVPQAEFTELDRLYRESDVITLHMPLTGENRHMINREAISRMKDGVLLVNTARGGLINTDDLIRALEEEKLGGAGIDTVEGEEGICHIDLRTRIVDRRNLFYLKQFPNVIFTQHYAFFTEEATAAMVSSALNSLALFRDGKPNPYEVPTSGK